MHLTKDQEKRRKQMYLDLEEDRKWFEAKVSNEIIQKMGRVSLYKKAIAEIKKVMSKEWMEENFSELVEFTKKRPYMEQLTSIQRRKK